MSALALARLSLHEIARQRYTLLPIVLTVALAVAGTLPTPSLMVNGNPVYPGADQLVQIAYGVLTFAGMGLGALVGAGMLAPEIERGTVLLLVTKPMARAWVVLGKALGGLAFLVACFLVWGLVLAGLLALRGAPELAPAALGGMVAGVAPSALMLGVAMAFSSRWPTGGALGLTFCAWALAGLASLLRNLAWESLPALVRIAREASWLVPWTDLMRLPSALAFGPAPDGWVYLALLAIPAWVGLAIALFSQRDLG
jgi:ABC-type transport system involved in multi-copper enzyme maturation permease subunit